MSPVVCHACIMYVWCQILGLNRMAMCVGYPVKKIKPTKKYLVAWWCMDLDCAVCSVFVAKRQAKRSNLFHFCFESHPHDTQSNYRTALAALCLTTVSLPHNQVSPPQQPSLSLSSTNALCSLSPLVAPAPHQMSQPCRPVFLRCERSQRPVFLSERDRFFGVQRRRFGQSVQTH